VFAEIADRLNSIQRWMKTDFRLDFILHQALRLSSFFEDALLGRRTDHIFRRRSAATQISIVTQRSAR
jgi:hypothetical protein